MFVRAHALRLRSAIPLCASALLLALPGCRKDDRAAGNDALGTVFAAAAKQAADLHLAYSHEITIGLPAKADRTALYHRARSLPQRRRSALRADRSLDRARGTRHPYPSAPT